MTFPTAAIKHYARNVGGSTPPPDEANWEGDITWFTPTDISSSHGGEIATSGRTLSVQGLAACSATLTPPGSVVVTTRAPIGNVALTRVQSATNQGCRTLVPDARLHPRYLRYQLQTRSLELQSCGAGSTFLELSNRALGATLIRVPWLDRQRAITEFLDRESERIVALAPVPSLGGGTLLGEFSALLAEYRAALITEAVTGRLDVTRLSEQQLDESAHAAMEGELPEVLQT